MRLQTPFSGQRAQVGLLVLLALAYVITGRISLLLSTSPAHIAFVWLPAGISLAALVRGGARLAPAIALGAFAVHFSAGSPVAMALAAALGSTVAALTALWILQRHLGFSRTPVQSRHLLSLIGVGAFATPIIAATLETAAAYATGLMQPEQLPMAWAVKWAADALGLLLIAPVLLWLDRNSLSAQPAAPLVALVGLQLVVGAFVFALNAAPNATQYVYLALALVTAMYLPFAWVTLVNLLAFALAAAGTVLGSGPFAEGGLGGFSTLQIYGIASSLATLLISSLADERQAVAAELRDSVERFKQLTSLSSDWYWEQDENLRFIEIAGLAVEEDSVGRTRWDIEASNAQAGARAQLRFVRGSGKGLEQGGFALDEGLGKTRWEIPAEDMSDQAWAAHRATLERHEPFRDFVVKRKNRDGQIRYISLSGEPVFDRRGEFTGYRGIGRDVTAQKLSEQALRDSEERFRDFADAAREYVWETDLEERFTYVSSRVQSVWGYSDQELIGRATHDLMPPGEAERVAGWLRHNSSPDGSFRDLEHMIVNRQGETRWLLIDAVSLLDSSGRRIGRRGTGRDITERKAAEARISYLATRDPLTELPNRVLFNDRLEQGIVLARRTGQSLALLFIDLDRFKNINDSLGHPVGDLLLKEVAARMQLCIRKGDTVSRLGGDEFVVTLEGLQQAEDASQVAGKIIKSLARPFDIAGHTLNTSCSIGISIYPIDADDDRTLMKNADTAMYHAKEKGRNNYQFFSQEMTVRAVERQSLETALRQAVERQQFTLFYQPQVDLRSGKVVGMEALLRWQHPDRGLLTPAAFIAVAEESGLIEPIGEWALHTACERAKAWVDAGYPPMKVAVNISPRLVANPREFARSIYQILTASGLEPRLLELEMTESLLVHTAEDNIAVLRKLGQDGVRIAVDDFGTGYSSVAYLRRLPIDSLKIDRRFVRDIESDPDDMAIVQAIVAMAHSLGLKVAAEGVETRGQLTALAHVGCDEYQGYLFSRPLPAVEIAARFLAPIQLDFE